MGQDQKKFYMTTAIAYASGKPHIGNTYEIILGDSIARFKRLEGYDVRMQTGTDEHGQKIQGKAQKAGKTPQEFVDEISGEIKRIYDLMNTSYDRFIRTTDEDHKIQVRKMFKKMYDKGDIYKGHYEGLYCTPCESFFTEAQLVDGKCPDCGGEVSHAKEEAYFFKMSKYADRLMKYIEENPKFIQPESRKNEMINNFLKPGLQDLCVSRTSFTWGIPVDFDPGHVVYVWIDALSNYITGVEYDVDGDNGELFRYWPADLHLIGKDILRFHTIYWPIMLMSLDAELPGQVFGHPWLLTNEGKMSKTKGNVIYADDLVDIFGVDAVRYFCLHEMPFENDGVISWDLMLERFDSELANTLGNLVNRTIVMANKYLDGKAAPSGCEQDPDDDLKTVVTGARDEAAEFMDNLHVADALSVVFNLFKRCNKYIDETEPWVLGRDEANKERLSEVLFNLLESITIGANLLSPFMPDTANRILEQIYAGDKSLGQRSFEELDKFGLRTADAKVTDTPEILFARMDFDEVKEKVFAIEEKQKAMSSGASSIVYPKAEPKDEISIDDFDKVQIRVGEVLECEPVPKSKKLLVSQIRVGDEVRQIVSGIAKFYSPEDMIGKKVAVITNLAPAKLCGVESQGMILAATDNDGNLSLMTIDKDILPGSEIG